MSSLKNILLQDGKRPLVLQDCVALIDDEVSAKSGLSGLAIKTVYSMVKTIKPNMIMQLTEFLLEPFAEKLDPFYQQCAGKNIEDGLKSKSSDIASALLSITDKKAEQSNHQVLKKAYEKLRPTGLKHVEQAVPKIAQLIAKHV